MFSFKRGCSSTTINRCSLHLSGARNGTWMCREDCTARLPKEDKATAAGDIWLVWGSCTRSRGRTGQGKVNHPLKKINCGVLISRGKHHHIHTSLWNHGGIIEYSELEGIHKNHQVQVVALHRIPQNPSQSLRALFWSSGSLEAMPMPWAAFSVPHYPLGEELLSNLNLPDTAPAILLGPVTVTEGRESSTTLLTQTWITRNNSHSNSAESSLQTLPLTTMC